MDKTYEPLIDPANWPAPPDGTYAPAGMQGPLLPRALRKASPEARDAADFLQRLAVSHDAVVSLIRDEGVPRCREAGLSWDSIGFLIGTTGRAAQMRFGGVERE